MNVFTIVLIGIGAIILIGLFIQFKLTTPKGFIFIIAAIGSFFGLSLFAKARRKKLLNELQNRKLGLAEQEKKLSQLQNDYSLSEREVQEAQKAIRRDKIAYMRSILMIDAEKEKNAEHIANMSPEEIDKAFAKVYGD